MYLFVLIFALSTLLTWPAPNQETPNNIMFERTPQMVLNIKSENFVELNVSLARMC